jgi:hypothetical protein
LSFGPIASVSGKVGDEVKVSASCIELNQKTVINEQLRRWVLNSRLRKIGFTVRLFGYPQAKLSTNEALSTDRFDT